MSETAMKGLAAIVNKGKKPAATPVQTELEDAIRLTMPAEKTRAARAMGKSRNPAYERMTVYVPTETRKKAERKWEDAGGGDLSDFIEDLLTKYVNA